MKKLFLFLTFIIISATINAQDSLSVYTGKYVFPDGSVVPDVEVTLTDGGLIMASVAGTSSLVRMGVDSFTITEFSGIAVFKRDENNKVNAVHIDAMGYILEGKKQETGAWVFSTILSEKPKEYFIRKQ